MSDYLFEVAKLAVAFVSGATLILVREHIAARLDRSRKRRALWRACELETESAYVDFMNALDLRDRLQRGRPIGGVFHATMTSAKLAEKLVDLDPVNVHVYLPFIIRAEQHEQRTAHMRQVLTAHAKLSPEERMTQAGAIISELLFSARAIAWLYSDRLQVMRVLQASAPDRAFAGKAIDRTEAHDRDIRSKIEQWEDEHSQALVRAGSTPSPRWG